jgi:type II secretory pathway pseudopilin PulG
VSRAVAAFTLLELVLVLTVLGLMSAVAASRLGGLRTSQGVDQAAQQVLDQVRRSQHLATTQACSVRLRLDLTEKTAAIQLLHPQGIKDPADGQEARIRFYEGADDLSVSYARDDGVAMAGPLIDLLFLPDARCETPGLLTIVCQQHYAAVRCHAGARPPRRETVGER